MRKCQDQANKAAGQTGSPADRNLANWNCLPVCPFAGLPVKITTFNIEAVFCAIVPPMKSRVIFFLFLISQLTFAEILFSNSDETEMVKREVLQELIAFMGPNGAATYVANHDKVVLWTDEAAVLPGEVEGSFRSTTLPSYTMASPQNKKQLQKIIQEQTGREIPLEMIAGILIANPYQGAIMYYRRGYLGKGDNEEDGRVAPIVIIYHELSHAKDSLQSPMFFSEMAASFNKRYKNNAEESAVHQQNDFILTTKAQGLDLGDLRQSYGKNDLVMVGNPYQVP